MNFGAAVETARSKTGPAKDSKRSFAGEREIIQAEAAKDGEAARCVVVYARVKTILVVRPGARTNKVIKHTAPRNRRRK